MQMPKVQVVTDDDPVVRIGEVVVRFHPMPGHTPGSCAIEHSNSLFTGDTLYSRGVGLSSLPGESADLLRQSILAIWDQFGENTIVRPGHGESAAFGWVKKNNSALLKFLKALPEAPTSP